MLLSAAWHNLSAATASLSPRSLATLLYMSFLPISRVGFLVNSRAVALAYGSLCLGAHVGVSYSRNPMPLRVS